LSESLADVIFVPGTAKGAVLKMGEGYQPGFYIFRHLDSTPSRL